MGYEKHVFYKPTCDYPGCERHLDVTSDWYYDPADMVDSVEDCADSRIILKGPDGEQIGMVRADSRVARNLVLCGDDGKTRFFCPGHLATRDGRHVGYNERYEETKPRSPELAEYYRDGCQPLPKPECERMILDILRTPREPEPDESLEAALWAFREDMGNMSETLERQERMLDSIGDKRRRDNASGGIAMARVVMERLDGILEEAGR